MSRNQKNNHYHYAEKFENKRKPRFKRTTPLMPFKAVIASLVVLMIFGFVSTTFGAYVFENEPAPTPEQGGIISTVRNIKSTRDVAVTGANVDLAETGWSFSGGYIYFDNTVTGWSDNSIQLVIGKDNYSSCYTMSKVTNTNYYVASLPTSGWGDAKYMAVMGNSSAWGDGSWGSSNLSNANHRTAAYTSGLDASANQRYIFTPSSSSNGCSLSLEYRGTDNTSMNIVSLKAIACHSTDGSTYTENTDTGGTVKITGYYFNAYNSITTSTTDANATEEYASAKTISTKYVTFTATVKSGYRFVGWYTASTGGTLKSSNATYSSYSTNSGDLTLYARFIKRYTVTVAKNPTGYTGSPTAGGSTSSTTVDAGSTVTLNADVKTGVTFGGWTFSGSKTFASDSSATSNPCTIIPSANVTATANYTLNKPTNLSISYPTVVVGNTSTPTKSATSPSSGTLSYSYSITTASGTTAASDTYSVNSSGVVTASVPGKYTVTMSVTTTAYGLTSAASTKTATVTVKPAAPDSSVLKYLVEGWTDDYTQGTTGVSYSTPIKVPINSETFTITAWLSSTLEGYSYNWSNVTGNYNTSNGAITAISGARTKTVSNNYRSIDRCTDSDTALLVGSDGHYAYQINVKASYNSVESNATQLVLYYDVISDFLDIQWMSFTENSNEWQKIYAEDNDITQIKSEIRAGGTTFNTALDFSKDNITYTPVEVWTALGSFINSYGTYSPKPNDSDHQTSALHKTFDVTTIMGHLGAKWIRVYMNDTGNNKTASATRVIHTTVGTRSTVANRPIYYYDNTGSTYVNSRVMAFFIRSSDAEPTVRYQTAQALEDGNNNTYYRFYIPEDATQITFAHVSTNNYVLPTYTNGTFSYAVYTNNQVLMAWSEIVDLSDSANYGKTTYKATAATTDGNGIKNYTGSMTTFGG